MLDMFQNQQEGQCGWREVCRAEKGQEIRESMEGIMAVVMTSGFILSDTVQGKEINDIFHKDHPAGAEGERPVRELTPTAKR